MNGSRHYAHNAQVSLNERLDNFFEITKRRSTVWTEIRAGLVTFVTMAYILMVNPGVLTVSGTKATGGVMPFNSIATATALSSAVASLMVGLLGNLPFGLAPGMGLNSYFTYGVCLHLGLTWQVALAACFVHGVLFMILSLSGACSLIQAYAPPCIKKSITVGLGLFQALIGFECIKLVVKGQDVLLGLGDMTRPDVWLALAGVLLISILIVLEVKASMLVGILFVTLVAWATGISPAPESFIELPELMGTLGQLDFANYFHQFSRALPVTLVFLFVSIFDTAGVQFGAGTQAGLIGGDGKLPNSVSAFFSAAFATTIGAVFGTSPVIIHNETCAGIQDGGRTGLTAVTVAVCFIVTLPFAPIFKAVPAIATAPPLIVVGMFMMAHAKFIDWESSDEGMPAFVVVTMLPFTYSIANGMMFGLGTYAVIKTGTVAIQWLSGKRIQPMLDKDGQGFHDPVAGGPKSPFVRKRGVQRARKGSADSDQQYGLDADDADLEDDAGDISNADDVESAAPAPSTSSTTMANGGGDHELSSYQADQEPTTTTVTPQKPKKQSSFRKQGSGSRGRQGSDRTLKIVEAEQPKPANYGST